MKIGDEEFVLQYGFGEVISVSDDCVTIKFKDMSRTFTYLAGGLVEVKESKCSQNSPKS